MKTVIGIQYLRAIAALAVVYHHVFENHNASNLRGYAFGLWGVDTFFIVSGFVMWVTTTNSSLSAMPFWRKRVVRIYPIYWIALTIWILARLAVPDRLNNHDVTTGTLISSYLLLPHYHAVFTEQIWPILVPGWTLQYELFFYLIFGLALFAASRSSARLAFIIVVLGILSAAGILLRPKNALLSIYTNSLLLEFGAGVLLGLVYEKTILLSRGPALAAIVLGFAGAMIGERYLTDGARVLLLGMPCFLLVLGVLSLEEDLARRPIGLLVRLGDASYSLYLFHSITIGLMAILWSWIGLQVLPIPLFVAVAIFVSAAAALLIYQLIERPMLQLLRPRRRASPNQASRATPAAS